MVVFLAQAGFRAVKTSRRASAITTATPAAFGAQLRTIECLRSTHVIHPVPLRVRVGRQMQEVKVRGANVKSCLRPVRPWRRRTTIRSLPIPPARESTDQKTHRRHGRRPRRQCFPKISASMATASAGVAAHRISPASRAPTKPERWACAIRSRSGVQNSAILTTTIGLW